MKTYNDVKEKSLTEMGSEDKGELKKQKDKDRRKVKASPPSSQELINLLVSEPELSENPLTVDWVQSLFPHLNGSGNPSSLDYSRIDCMVGASLADKRRTSFFEQPCQFST